MLMASIRGNWSNINCRIKLIKYLIDQKFLSKYAMDDISNACKSLINDKYTDGRIFRNIEWNYFKLWNLLNEEDKYFPDYDLYPEKFKKWKKCLNIIHEIDEDYTFKIE